MVYVVMPCHNWDPVVASARFGCPRHAPLTTALPSAKQALRWRQGGFSQRPNSDYTGRSADPCDIKIHSWTIWKSQVEHLKIMPLDLQLWNSAIARPCNNRGLKAISSPKRPAKLWTSTEVMHSYRAWLIPPAQVAKTAELAKALPRWINSRRVCPQVVAPTKFVARKHRENQPIIAYNSHS